MKVQIGVAALALFILGVVYGGQSLVLSAGSCEVTQIVNARIAAVHKIEARRVQYVVELPNCRLLVTSSRFPLYAAGQELRLAGKIEYGRDFPSELAGFRTYLARRGIAGTVRYPQIELVRQEGGESLGVRGILRDRVIRLFPEPEASAVLAMVFGQGATLPKATVDDFRLTGVSHILAISGMNLSLLAGAIWGVSLVLPIRSVWRTLLVIALMWLYVWIIVFPVSAVRAAWFWTLALSALQLHWLVGLPTIFLFAIAGMVTLNPQILWEIGFQLSVSAVAGMWLAAFLIGKGKPQRIPKWLWLTVLATVGATLTTWPIVAHYFGIVSVVSLLANILIVPPVSAFMVLSLLAIAIYSLVPPLALIVSFGVRLLWQWMTRVATWLAGLPGAAISDVALPAWFLIVYYAALLAVALVIMKYQRRNWREVWE